jgi:integrase
MKAGREHRVPLSNRTISIPKKLRDATGGEFVFPGQKSKKPLSNMAIATRFGTHCELSR